MKDVNYKTQTTLTKEEVKYYSNGLLGILNQIELGRSDLKLESNVKSVYELLDRLNSESIQLNPHYSSGELYGQTFEALTSCKCIMGHSCG